MSPSDWSSSASREPPCSTSAYRIDTRPRALPDSLGWIALPSTLVLHPTKQSNLQVYASADSTVLEMWVSPEPSASLMTLVHSKLQTEAQCRITVGSRFALVTPFLMTDSSQQRVRHAAIVNAVVLEGVTLNFLVGSPTDSGRSVLLGVLTHLQQREFPAQ